MLSRQNERHLKCLGTGKQYFRHFIKVTLFTNYNPPCRLLSSWPPSQARSFPSCQPPSKSRWKPSVFLVGDLLLLDVHHLHDHLVNHIFDQFRNILQIHDCVIDFNSSPEQALRVLNTHSKVQKYDWWTNGVTGSIATEVRFPASLAFAKTKKLGTLRSAENTFETNLSPLYWGNVFKPNGVETAKQ